MRHDTPQLQLDGKQYVVVPAAEYEQLLKLRDDGAGSPLPARDKRGTRPAAETMRAIIAQQLVADRKAAGLTQQRLADLAGVRQETISRIESGKHIPGERTMEKIDAALAKIKCKDTERRRRVRT